MKLGELLYMMLGLFVTIPATVIMVYKNPVQSMTVSILIGVALYILLIVMGVVMFRYLQHKGAR
jgi:hypothetical protein